MHNIAHWAWDRLKEATSNGAISISTPSDHHPTSSVTLNIDLFANTYDHQKSYSSSKNSVTKLHYTPPPHLECGSTHSSYFCPHQTSNGCIFCYMNGMDDYLSRLSLASFGNENADNTSVLWRPPFFINAGISRAQVSLDSGKGALAVEFCSSALARKHGLDLAAAIAKLSVPHKRYFKYSLMDTQLLNAAFSQYSGDCLGINTELQQSSENNPCSSVQFSKLDSCTVPTDQINAGCSLMSKVTPAYVSNSFDGLPNDGFHSHKTKKEPHDCADCAGNCILSSSPNHALFSERTDALSHTAVTSDLSINNYKSTHYPTKPSIKMQDFGVMSVLSWRSLEERNQRGLSDIFQEYDYSSNSEMDDPDGVGLELDDDGVWLLSNDNLSDIFKSATINTSGYSGENISKKKYPSRFDGSCISELNNRNSKAKTESGVGHVQSHKFSRLVSLTAGISEDLLSLESGCQELMHRLQRNRIELDYMRHSLIDVHDRGDNCSDHSSVSLYTDNPPETQTIQDLQHSSEKSRAPKYSEQPLQLKINSSNIILRQDPLGKSFISEPDDIPRKCCNCRYYYSDGSIQDSSNYFLHISGCPSQWSMMSTSLTKPLCDDQFNVFEGQAYSTGVLEELPDH